MPSPFPGMDPFLEGQKWRSFHTRLINVIGDALMPSVRPRYVIDVEENVYLAREDGDLPRVIAPDVSVIQKSGWMENSDGSVAVETEPALLTLPAIDSVPEHYLVIRSRANDDVVTVIEVLSPTNKLDGRSEYLNKRDAVLHSEANLVEIDLLRGGKRLPTVERLPHGNYFAFVTRVERRPKVEVYSWPLERRLPKLPIPLAEGDPDVWLDLQDLFNTTYDRAGYDYALNYTKPIEPPLNEAQAQWAAEMLAKSTLSKEQ
ncbi:MAG: DUF4058 family protein [Planctomycetaceae bacterium]